MKITEVLSKAKKSLIENNIDDREARLLLSYVLDIKSEDLIKYNEISDENCKKYEEVINKRCNHIPYAYIVGHKEFMKLDFKVNENVLIPREDTEILVEEVINICNGLSNVRVLDVCTGSGCIAISLTKYIADASVTALDISEKALLIAKENATNNGVKVSFIQSDLFENINDKYDIIVSNPPYIERKVIETLQDEVKNNEPIIALDGGEDGLDFYRKISFEAKKYLNENGYLIFEIGFDQARDVIGILKKDGYKDVIVKKDYSGNDRVVVANV